MNIEVHNGCHGISLTYLQALNILQKKVKPNLGKLWEEDIKNTILDKMKEIMHWLAIDSEALPRSDNPDFEALIRSSISGLEDMLTN